MASLVFPTDGYPNDNYIFLRRDANGGVLDPVDMYPSRCAISATEDGVFGQAGPGHVDDYYDGSSSVHLSHPLGVLSSPFPLGSSLDPYFPGTTHTDNCIADYTGTSRYKSRNQKDGSSAIRFLSVQAPLGNWGDPYRWHPTTQYPVPISPYTTVDATWGLAQYISQKAGYHCKTTSWTYNGTVYQYEDVADFYNLSIAGYRPPGSTSGATPQDIIDEIDAGRPVIAVMWTLNIAGGETTLGHAFPVFGYRRIIDNGQPNIEMLIYDTWNEDFCVNQNTGLPYESTCYRIVKFPNASEIPHKTDGSAATGFFRRTSESMDLKIYGFCFLKINNNARCAPPLLTSQYTQAAHDTAFDATISNSAIAGCTRVHYASGNDPTPASPYVTLDASGNGTKPIHVDASCTLKFRTYRDAPSSTPEDGYLASAVDSRTFTVTAPNRNPKKYADGDGIITAPLVVTIGTGPLGTNICYVEDQDRVSGIRVQTSNCVTQGDLVTVSGTLGTNSDGERIITSAAVTSLGATDQISPIGIINRSLGGGNLNYIAATGAGQRGITNGSGLNNIGLLVRTTGTVLTSGTSAITISDGSNAAIKIILPSGLTPPAANTCVCVTGVSSCELAGENVLPVLRVRGEDDLREYIAPQMPSRGSQASAPSFNVPLRSRPLVPAIEATDNIAWALNQSDGYAVTVKACSVLDASINGLTISDGWTRSAATIRVPGNWAVKQWSTVDVTGVITTLADGTRAITASQILVYTDSKGKRYEFPMTFWRAPTGLLIGEWPYKEVVSSR